MQIIQEFNYPINETVEIYILIRFRNGGREIMIPIKITSGPPIKKEVKPVQQF